MTIKWDGHTHTEYCPHGSGDDAELQIQKAIKLGFKRYSVTEHAPLPPGIWELAAGPKEIWTTGAMDLKDVPHYFKKFEGLKAKYASDIDLRIGFELDYFTACHDWTKDFLAEYGPRTTDGILSVHFIEGNGGLRGIDFSSEDYEEGIVTWYTSFQKAQTAYYQLVMESLQADLGPYKPRRLGHISLCQKFQLDYSPDEGKFSATSQKLIEKILLEVQRQGVRLDLNTAGLFKEACQEIYPPLEVVRKAKALGIPLMYGSDSHGIADVGRGYEEIAGLLV